MNFAASNHLSTLPHGFIAALAALLFLAVTGKATGPSAGVNPARGAVPHADRLARSGAIFGAREARSESPAALVATGFGLEATRAGVARGGGAGNPIFLHKQNDERPRWTSPAAAMAVSAAVNQEARRA